jgi:hypothetical protein
VVWTGSFEDFPLGGNGSKCRFVGRMGWYKEK